MNAQSRIFRPSARLGSIGVSEILKITADALARQKSGRPVIILGAGEPDFDTPDNIKNAAERAMWRGETKYTALDGSGELKAAIVEKFRRDNGLEFSPAEISCGAGAKQILYNAFMATLDEGDEVVIPAPYWTSYADIVAICGGVPVVCATAPECNFVLAPEQLEACITPRTRWLLLNSPSNPSGAVYGQADLAALAQVLDRHPQVWVMSDDIYEHLLYDGARFLTMAMVAPRLRERMLIVNGVSKAYAMTGWRIGYGAGPAALIRAMAVVQSQSTSCPSSISQAAAIEALTGPQAIIAERKRIFQDRRDVVVAALNGIPGMGCNKPQGAFYAFASCEKLLDRRTPDGKPIATDVDFCRYLLDAVDVAVVPGSCFGMPSFFRLSYAIADGDLFEACTRIDRACHGLL